MAILTVSLFLPYTVHFEINDANRAPVEPVLDSSTGERRHASVNAGPVLIHSPKPVNISGTENRGLLGPRRQVSSSLLASASPSPVSTSPITKGFGAERPQGTVRSSSTNIAAGPSASNINAGATVSANRPGLPGSTSVDATNADFFYKNPLRQSSSNLSSAIAPLGETESHVVNNPNDSFVLRKNPSFSYIQPRSRAETASPPVIPSIGEGRQGPPKRTINLSGAPLQKSPNLLKAASLNNMNGADNAREVKKPAEPKTSAKPNATSGLAKFQLGDDVAGSTASVDSTVNKQDAAGDKVVPYGGFSSPNVGQNILHSDSIFNNSPWTITDYGKGNGGLRNALNFALEDQKIENIKWVGTTGMATDALSQKTKDSISQELDKNHNSVAVFSDDFTFQGHYKHFCKQILWPTLHYQVPDEIKPRAFEENSWEYYRKLNELFADRIAEIYNEDDVIWIHDYHLLLLPNMLRERLGSKAKIGFFLHTAFPSSEVFRCLAQRKSLLLGMIGANSIGFQIPEYCRHFLQTCNRILLADVVNNDGLLYDGKYIDVYSTPVGIDANKLAKQIDEPAVHEWEKLIQERWAGKKLIVNRDKLDRLRGVKQKLLAYEKFLKKHPEFIEKVIFIQICLKSNNADSDLELEIMLIVERINSLTTDFTLSQPVVLLNQDIDFQQYLALLSNADTFIVSTMREGMNLTCHEFIVATKQNKPPLILSEFTGSASIFQKGALLVNPWNLNQISNQIYSALTMSEDEKKDRWNLLYKVLIEKNCYNWIHNSLDQIQIAYTRQQERRKTNLIQLNSSQFVKICRDLKYKHSSGKKIFILDFDSIAVGEGDRLLSAAMVTDRKLSVISELTADPSNVVFITSYMKKSDLDLMYGRISNIGLISENGGYIRLPKLQTASNGNVPNNALWISLVNDQELLWMDSAMKVITSMVERLPGSYLEVEECTIRFHTEKSDDRERAAATISDCISHVNEMFEDENIHATAIKDMVVIQQMDLTIKALSVIVNYIATGTINLNKFKLLSPSTNSSPISQPDHELFPPSINAYNGPGDSLNIASGTPNDRHGNLMSPASAGVQPAVTSPQKNNLDLLIYISRSNPITEQVFEYCNKLSSSYSSSTPTSPNSSGLEGKLLWVAFKDGKSIKIDNVFTVVAGQCGDTNASSRVDGMNKLLNILSSI